MGLDKDNFMSEGKKQMQPLKTCHQQFDVQPVSEQR